LTTFSRAMMSRTMNPRIVAVSGPLKGSKFPVGPFDLLIGKGRTCHVRLDDRLVSARHCGISHEGPRPMLWDIQSRTGTYVNGFHFPGKTLVYGDRIRVGRSILVYLDRNDADVDSAILKRTAAEEEWDRKIDSGQSGPRAPTYQPEAFVVLEAFLDFHGKINSLRDPDEIQSRVFELIFSVMPVGRTRCRWDSFCDIPAHGVRELRAISRRRDRHWQGSE
jgi:pSer/pThr/pTyr-binding forkhead associated (FHA) protein